MGSDTEADRDVIELGNEPEFIVHDMPRWEDAGDGLIRVYVASMHGSCDRMEYSFVCTQERLAYMCRKGLMFAAEAHNRFAMVSIIGH